MTEKEQAKEMVKIIQTRTEALLKEGRFEEALLFTQQYHEICLNTLGENNIKTINALMKVGEVLSFSKRYKEALEINKKSYESLVKKAGEINPISLNLLTTIGQNLMELKKYDEALEVNQKCYDIAIELFGENKIIELQLANLASSLLALKRQKEAIDLHQNYSNRFIKRGDRFANKNEENKALNEYKKSFDYRAKVFGKDSRTTLIPLMRIIRLLTKMQKFDDLLIVQNRYHKTLAKGLGNNHEKVIHSEYQIACTMISLKKYEEALVRLQFLHERMERIFGIDDGRTLCVLSLIAECYNDLNRFDECNVEITKCYELCRKKFGDKDIKTVTALMNLAGNYIDVKNYKKALEIYQYYYSENLDAISEELQSMADLNDYAFALNKLRKYSEALIIHEKAYEKMVKFHGKEHPNVVASLSNIADSLAGLERYQEAYDKYKEGYELGEKVLEKGDRVIRKTKRGMKRMQEKLK